MADDPRAPRISLASDHAFLISFGGEISREGSERVLRVASLLRSRPEPAILDFQPAYATVLVRFDPRRTSAGAVEGALERLLERTDRLPDPEKRRIEIPVHYGGSHGPDLPDVARHAGLSREEVVRLHASGDYEVAFLGFTPGFPYLSGLPPELTVPRLPTPRTRVPAGSVAIGGSQAGVYPLPSPGGWRLIGWTPLRLFDPEREPVALLRTGDRVRFVVASSDSGRRP